MERWVVWDMGTVRRNVLVSLFLLGLVVGVQGSGNVQAARFLDQTTALGLSGLGGGAACWIDFNNDGWVDLYADGILWRNNAGASFTAINLGVGSPYGVWGDFNNDGYPDFFSMGNYKMYRNNSGSGSMTQLTTPTLPMDSCLGASFADHNNDRFIDLYVGGYEDPNYLPDAILRNVAGTSFTMSQPEPTSALKPGRGITSCDFDEDGDQDVYVSNYRLEANYLWLNNGSGTFADVAPAYGVEGIYDGWSYSYGHTIGSCWGDLDNDGHFDLFVGNFSHSWGFPHQDTTRFYRNLGSGGSWHFQDKSSTAGLAWQESYASPALGDFDNDGDVDFYFTTVYATDSSSGVPNYPVLYRNNGNWTFTDVTATEGLSYLSPTYQAAWADFNHDGKLDLVTAGKLFVNTGAANHWLGVRLRSDGTAINRSAIGAQVRITVGSQILTRQVEAGTGQGNENDFTLHFGLGSTTGPVNLEIRWPDRTTTTLSSAVDQILVVDRAPCLQVTPADNLTASGPQGGPFSPTGKTYTLTNTSSQSINWTAGTSQPWITLSATGGTLAAGASTTVNADFNATANTLTTSTTPYTGTLTFTNTTNASGPTTRSASLTVNAPPSLQVTPSDNLTASGYQGGPFSPSSKVYTLTNIGSQSLYWRVTRTQNWVSPSAYSGTLAAGASTGVTVSFNVNTDALAAGSTPYTATLTFTNQTDGSGTTSRSVSLTVNPPPNLKVTPSDDFIASGPQGGPFTPSSKIYTLTNITSQSLSWRVTRTGNWVIPSVFSGTLAAGASTNVTIGFNSYTEALTANSSPYTANLTFTNQTDTSGNSSRPVSLTVQPVVRGILALGDFSGDKTQVTGTVQVRQGISTVRTDNLSLSSAGAFSLVNVTPPGTYGLAIKASHWLRTVVSNVTVTAAVTDLGTVSLTNGDVDNSNQINAADLSILLAALDSAPISDARADLDGNGAVESTDLAILLANFDRVGDL